jgi:hypothetical protein
MDELDVKQTFGRLLEARPPLPPRLGRAGLVGTGRRALRRRRVVRASVGSALVVAALAAGVTARAVLPGAPLPGGGPIRGTVGPADPGPITPPVSADVPRASAAPPAGPALTESEHCRTGVIPESPKKLLPDTRLQPPASVVEAVRAVGPQLAPGARVTFVHVRNLATSSKTHAPLLVVSFDVVDPGGAGGLTLEIQPFGGVTARRLADFTDRYSPYGNCVPAEHRAEPDGSAGLLYPKPIGDYRQHPNDVVVRASYFSVHGIEVEATAVPFANSVLWADEQRHPGGSVGMPPPTRRTLPLTPQQLYEFARVAGSVPAR